MQLITYIHLINIYQSLPYSGKFFKSYELSFCSIALVSINLLAIVFFVYIITPTVKYRT